MTNSKISIMSFISVSEKKRVALKFVSNGGKPTVQYQTIVFVIVDSLSSLDHKIHFTNQFENLDNISYICFRE